jgi:hypothetical protein
MEELQHWIQLGRTLNIKKTKFELISRQAYKNIEKIQENIKKTQEMMTCLETITDESIEFYSKTLQRFQEALLKQFEFTHLKSLTLIFSVLRSKLRLRSTRFNCLMILNTCKVFRRLLVDLLDMPFKDIIYMALFELDMIKHDIKEKMLM